MMHASEFNTAQLYVRHLAVFHAGVVFGMFRLHIGCHKLGRVLPDRLLEPRTLHFLSTMQTTPIHPFSPFFISIASHLAPRTLQFQLQSHSPCPTRDLSG